MIKYLENISDMKIISALMIAVTDTNNTGPGRK